jgi:ABC-2 type transport system permease protein
LYLAVECYSLTKLFPAANGWRKLFDRGTLSQPAVDAVDLTIQRGELFGLLGPNGAGKTTLIKMLSTLVQPTSGSARVNGYSLEQESALKATIGLVTSDERSFYWRLSGVQNLAFFARLYGLPEAEIKQRVPQVMEQLDLQEVADQRFQTYSTGMRQRLSIARALLNKPRLLFLDEPTKGLDPLVTRRLQQLVRQELVERQGITVLLTTHDLQEAEQICDRIAIMHHGRILAVGTQAELRQSLQLGDRFLIQVKSLPAETRARLEQDLPGIHLPDPPQVNSRLSEEEKHIAQIELPSQQGEAALNRAIDLLRADQVPILSVSNRQPSLEEVFTHHMQAHPGSINEVRVTAHINKSQQAALTGAPQADQSQDPAAPPSFWRIIPAFVKRDLVQEASYRLAFVLQFASIFFSVLLFYFISTLLGETATPYLAEYGGNYFAFVLIGIAFLGYFSTGLSSFANNLRHSQTTGTLEAMLTTPTRLSAIILASSVWDFLMTTLRVIVYLAVGVLLMRAGFSQANYPAAVVVILLTILVASSLGILSASFIMIFKRGDPIQWGISTLSILLGGVYFPVAILPPALEWISRLLPITYSLHAMRLALLQGAGWSEIIADLLILSLFVVGLMPLSQLAFRYAVRRAKNEGSLTHY